jgi:hypothetical protein
MLESDTRDVLPSIVPTNQLSHTIHSTTMIAERIFAAQNQRAARVFQRRVTHAIPSTTRGVRSKSGNTAPAATTESAAANAAAGTPRARTGVAQRGACRGVSWPRASVFGLLPCPGVFSQPGGVLDRAVPQPLVPAGSRPRMRDRGAALSCARSPRREHTRSRRRIRSASQRCSARWSCGPTIQCYYVLVVSHAE